MIVKRTAVLFLGACALAAAPAAAQDFNWSGRIADGRVIEIKGVNGGIQAVPASGGEVRVSATRNARRSNPADVRFEVIEHTGGVTICAVYPHRREPNECRPGTGGRMSVENNDVQVEWTVQVPRGVDFIGRTVNGGVTATGLTANAEGYTVNGAVRISTAGFARATTVNGGLDIAMGRTDWNQPLKFETVNGAITLTLGSDLNAQVSAATVNGDIVTDFPLEVQGRWGPRRVNGTVGRGGRELQLNTVNGSITLRRR